MADEDTQKDAAKTQWWPWALVVVAVVAVAFAARECGTDDTPTAGAPSASAPASAAGPPSGAGVQGKGVGPVVVDQEASSPRYRMKFKLGAPVGARPTGTDTGPAAPTVGSDGESPSAPSTLPPAR